MNFHPTTQKSENVFLMAFFIQSMQSLSTKNKEELSFMTLIVMQNLNKS